MNADDVQVQEFRLFIGGKWCASSSGETFDSIDPFRGEVWARIPLATQEDVDRAVTAAQAAFPAWRRTLGKERARLMRRLADVIDRNVDQLAALETRDNGKVIREMRKQVGSLSDYFHYWAGWADKIHGQVVPLDRADVFHYVNRDPIGVIAVITPFNSPLLLMTWTLAPAIAIGNVVVAKPSQYTSASTLAFGQMIEEAGLPPGVFNVVTGPGSTVGNALASHRGIDKIVFTGGEQGGRAIARAASEHLAPTLLELGGKSPNIVFADADIDAAVTGAMAGIFAAAGQTCVAGSRLLLQREIAKPFIDKLVERTRRIKLGDPSDPATEMGPVAFLEHLERIQQHVVGAVGEGAVVAVGGGRSLDADLAKGYFFEPTVLTDVRNEMAIAQEEVFGPVLSVIPFEDEQDAVRIANDSMYGLAAGVWTRDVRRALRMADTLEAGTVWVNMYRATSYAAPFGGYRKGSGHGRELGEEAIHELTRTKSVWFEIAGKSGDPFTQSY